MARPFPCRLPSSRECFHCAARTVALNDAIKFYSALSLILQSAHDASDNAEAFLARKLEGVEISGGALPRLKRGDSVPLFLSQASSESQLDIRVARRSQAAVFLNSPTWTDCSHLVFACSTGVRSNSESPKMRFFEVSVSSLRGRKATPRKSAAGLRRPHLEASASVRLLLRRKRPNKYESRRSGGRLRACFASCWTPATVFCSRRSCCEKIRPPPPRCSRNKKASGACV